jgi:hypothetical protein
MKINYYILHYNRPYFAEAHLKLARMYFPFVNKFILIDDGSDNGVIDSLRPNFDEVFQSSKNVNNWKNGSVGSLLSNAFKSLDSDVSIFAEDDFFPCVSYFDDSISSDSFISPDVIFNKKETIVGLDREDIDIMCRKEAIISLGRSNYGWKSYKTINSLNNIMEVDVSDLKRCYSNWPWAMPSLLANKIFDKIENLSIWQIESKVDENLKNYKKEKVKLYVPKRKNYIHVGFICSTRKEDFNSIGKFNKNRKSAFKNFTKQDINASLDENRSCFLKSYKSGKRIKIDMLFENGLHACLHDFISN